MGYTLLVCERAFGTRAHELLRHLHPTGSPYKAILMSETLLGRIGRDSTQDEYGTAAYKTVELDHILDDKVQAEAALPLVNSCA